MSHCFYNSSTTVMGIFVSLAAFAVALRLKIAEKQPGWGSGISSMAQRLSLEVFLEVEGLVEFQPPAWGEVVGRMGELGWLTTELGSVVDLC